MTSTHVVYRLYGESDVLLYVGISGKWFYRMGQHAAEKGWWDDVAAVKREVFPSRAEALAAEAKAILEEKPLRNIRGTKPKRPSQPPSNRIFFLHCSYDDGGTLLFATVVEDFNGPMPTRDLQPNRGGWWAPIAWVEIEQFRYRREAEERKGELVRIHRPPANSRAGGYVRRRYRWII